MNDSTDKIILNDQQLSALKKHFKGENDPFCSSDEERRALQEVIRMAEALMFKLNAFDESGDDLMMWFFKKYKAQIK